MSVKLLIIDNHPAVRRGLEVYFSLHKEINIIDVTSDGQEALELVRAVQKRKGNEALPDVVIIDLILCGTINGLATIEAFRQEFPNIQIFVNSFSLDKSSFLQAARLGVQGFFNKNADISLLAKAVTTVNGNPKPPTRLI
jgi:two-component system, NarL family, invasion response regulator UvrY